MKVLFLTRDLPYPPYNGYRKRNYYLIKELSSRGIDIILVTKKPQKVNNRDVELLRNYCNKIKLVEIRKTGLYTGLQLLISLFSKNAFSINRRLSKDIRDEVRRTIIKDKIDVVICDSIYQSLNIPLNVEICKILYEHNIESMIIKRYTQTEKNIFKRLFAFIEYRKVEKFQKRIWRCFDYCITCSYFDKNYLKRRVPAANVLVVNNGVDTEFFSANSYPVENKRLVYTGQMGWFPNEDAINYFIDEIFPLIKKEEPKVKLWIVGTNPSPRIKMRALKDNSIEVIGFVEDVRPFIGKAQVYIVPLRIGSGTRLKILEALSMRKAVVSTSVGCEGLEVEDNKNILIRDNPEDFARAVLALLRNNQLRLKLENNSRSLVEGKYDWKVVFKELDNLQFISNFKGSKRLNNSEKLS